MSWRGVSFDSHMFNYSVNCLISNYRPSTQKQGFFKLCCVTLRWDSVYAVPLSTTGGQGLTSWNTGGHSPLVSRWFATSRASMEELQI